MTIHEPITMATDYLLALAAAIFAVVLWRRGRRMWTFVFLFTATGTSFGGTLHGTGEALWWKPTVLSIGLASFFLLLAGTESRALHVAALLKFMFYATWMITHDSFLFVIVDYGIALIVVLCTQAYAWVHDRAESAPWIMSSVVVSVIAAVVQQAPIPWHNDVYHGIQLIALWLLYRGALVGSMKHEI